MKYGRYLLYSENKKEPKWKTFKKPARTFENLQKLLEPDTNQKIIWEHAKTQEKPARISQNPQDPKRANETPKERARLRKNPLDPERTPLTPKEPAKPHKNCETTQEPLSSLRLLVSNHEKPPRLAGTCDSI